MLDTLEILDARAPHHAADVVTFFQEQLGEVGTVLSRDPSDQRALRFSHFHSVACTEDECIPPFAFALVLPPLARAPIAILQSDDVVELWRGDLEYVAILDRLHAVTE